MRPFMFASCLLPDRHLILQKRVITAFLTQRRQRTMAGNKGHIIAQRQQLFLDSRNQLPMVAARKIAASHPAFENHVSGDQQSGGVIKRPHGPAYGRAVQHLQRHIPHIDHIAFIEPAIRTQRLAILEPNIRLCAGNPSSQNSSSFSGPITGTP